MKSTCMKKLEKVTSQKHLSETQALKHFCDSEDLLILSFPYTA